MNFTKHKHLCKILVAAMALAGVSNHANAARAIQTTGTAGGNDDWTLVSGNGSNGGADGVANAVFPGNLGITATMVSPGTAGTNDWWIMMNPPEDPMSASSSTTAMFQPPFALATTGGIRTRITGKVDTDAAGSSTGSPDSACAAGATGTTVVCHQGSLSFAFEHPVINPVIHIAGIGGSNNVSGGQQRQYQSWALASGGSLTVLSGTNLSAAGNVIRPSTIVGLNDGCQGTPETGGCGSVRATGTYSTLAFNTALNVYRESGSGPLDTSGVDFIDTLTATVTVSEDYGDAPASYDAGLAASHVLTDLRLGTLVTEENANVININNVVSSPIAGAGATNDSGDDGVTLPVGGVVVAAGAVTTVSVVLSGASKAGVVCGWIDFNKNGSFESTERACATFAAGAVTATLSFTTPAGTTVGTTYARFRASYDSTFTTTTALPNGLLDSGEVEDYQLALVNPARLTVTKTAIGGGSTFPFVLSGGISDATFQPNPNPPSTPSVSKTYTNVVTGTNILITENPPTSSGFTLQSISCANNAGGTPGSTIGAQNLVNNAATLGNITVNLTPGADVTCTFVNSKNVDLTLIKNTVGGNGSFNYAVTDSATSTQLSTPAITTSGGTGAADADFSVSNGSSRTVNITETVPAGWTLTAIACNATSGTITTNSTSLATGTINITAAAGSVGSCTFTNVRKPSVTIRKQSNGGTGSFSFTGGTNGLPASLSLNTATSNPISSTAFAIANIAQPATLTETALAGWTLTGWSCTTASSAVVASGATATMTIPASVLDDGNDLTCTFTNVRQATLRLQKQLPSGRFVSTDQFGLSIAGPTSGSVTTTGSGTTATETVILTPATIGGSYTLSETGVAGTNLANYTTSYNCSNAFAGGTVVAPGSGTSFSVTPQAGDDLTCTFVNTRGALSNLSITKTNTPGINGDVDQSTDTVTRGTPTTYTIVVTNNGPDAVTGATVRDPAQAGLICNDPVPCAGSGCPSATVPLSSLQSADGVVLDAVPNGGTVTFTLSCSP